MKRNLIIFLVFISLFLCFACNDEYDKDLNYQELTLEEIQTDSYIFKIIEEVEELTFFYGQGTGYPNETARNFWPNTNPDNTSTVTAFYTNFENINSIFNYSLNGSIVVKISGSLASSDFKREITFTNFNINGDQISGKMVITKSALITNKIKFESLKITYSDQTYYTRNGSLYFTLTHSGPSIDIWDNVYQVTGTVNGINRSNINFTSSIVAPLVKNVNYKHYISGKVNLSFDEAPVLVDFGNTVLDNLVNLTINGEEFLNVALKN